VALTDTVTAGEVFLEKGHKNKNCELQGKWRNHTAGR
jgi:hypothetical protein